MSRSRKHITTQLINSYPEPRPTESIVRVVSTRGTNQVEVEYPNKEKILVMMPSKFKKLVWTKKGDYLIIATDRSEHNRGKIKGIIEHVLLPHQIKHLKRIGVWPIEFVEKTPEIRDNNAMKEQEQEETENCKESNHIETETTAITTDNSCNISNDQSYDEINGSEQNNDEEVVEEDSDLDDEIYENPNRIGYTEEDEDEESDDE
jgi:probable RNA-binding protein EIF1AD